MKNLFEAFFCTGACKPAKNRRKHASALKGLVLAGVSALFCVNAAGCVLQAVLFRTPAQIAFCGVYAYCFLMTAVNYFMTAFMEPGNPRCCPRQLSRMCIYCNTPKPMRTHHCSYCDRCVVKMDHHCLWIQQCVGYNNYGQFIALLAWSAMTMVYSFIWMLVSLVMAFTVHELAQLLGAPLPVAYLAVTASALAITAVFGFVILKLLAFHLRLMARNKTTIEHYDYLEKTKLNGHAENPYDQGTRENLRQIVPHPLRLLVPFLRIKGDFDPFVSYDYEKNKDLALQFDFGDRMPVQAADCANTSQKPSTRADFIAFAPMKLADPPNDRPYDGQQEQKLVATLKSEKPTVGEGQNNEEHKRKSSTTQASGSKAHQATSTGSKAPCSGYKRKNDDYIIAAQEILNPI